jgi:hypothetical protein
VHLQIWVLGAPQYGVDSIADIQDFIDKYITTDSGSAEEELISLQRHTHSKRCGGFKGRCSFAYPRPPMPITLILEPLRQEEYRLDVAVAKADMKRIFSMMGTIDEGAKAAAKVGTLYPGEMQSFPDFLDTLGLTMQRYTNALRCSIIRTTVFHSRSLKDRNVNPFNVTLLLAWQANIDLQFILDAYAATTYITSYMSKGQKGMTELMGRLSSEGGYRNSSDLIKRLGYAFINSHEICVQEAVYHELPLPMRRFSVAVQFVNTGPPDQRYKMAKTTAELNELPPDSTDCFKKGPPEHYASRPLNLEEATFADYMAWYSWDAKRKVFTRRKKAKVLRWVHFKLDKDPDNFYREQIMLFTSWRNEVGLMDGYLSWEACFLAQHEQITVNKAPYQHFSEADWEALQAEADLQQAEIEQAEETIEEGDAFGDRLEVERAPKKPRRDPACIIQLKKHYLPQADYRSLVSSLNPKQRAFFDHVLHCVQQKDSAFKAFLSGGAGVGKSLVVTAITQAMMRHYESGTAETTDGAVVILLAAFTGKAAFNINGFTLHSALNLPPGQNKLKWMYTPLDLNTRTSMQARYNQLKFIIIDEISMVGRGMFNFVNLRMQEIMCCTEFFGGLHVLVVGDLFQLCPVGDSWVFKAGPLENNVWQEHFLMYELTEIMRQKGDARFAELLNRMREGLVTEADIALLSTRNVEAPIEVPSLFAYHEPKNTHNHMVMQQHVGQELHLHALHKIVARMLPQEKATLLERARQVLWAEDLASCLILKVGLPVKVFKNVRTADGLVNGASGTFRGKTGEGMSSLAWVGFDDETVGADTRAAAIVPSHLAGCTPIKL